MLLEHMINFYRSLLYTIPLTGLKIDMCHEVTRYCPKYWIFLVGDQKVTWWELMKFVTCSKENMKQLQAI